MTGEMQSIDKFGDDSNGESWPTHAALARALRGQLRPFDKYAGPYIQVPEGRLWLSSDDGLTGTVCLWPAGIPPAFCEPVTRHVPDCYDEGLAIEAARAVLRQYRRERKARAKVDA